MSSSTDATGSNRDRRPGCGDIFRWLCVHIICNMSLTMTWERALRNHGEMIATWPVFTIAVAYILSLQCGLGWTRMGTPMGVGARATQTRLWTPQDELIFPALMECDADYTLVSWEEWSIESGVFLMYLPKEEYKSTDLIDKESFAEMYDVFSKWWSISVITAQGNEYNTFDVCARRALPDGVGFPVYPCTFITVLDCFNETGAFLHPSYAVIDQMTPAPSPTTVPYHTKPSWKASTSPSELKAATSACTGWDPVLQWAPATMITKVVMEQGVVKAGNIFRHLLLYDGMKRAAWRTQYSNGVHMTMTERLMDLREARDMHSRVLEAIFFERAKTSTRFLYAAYRDFNTHYATDQYLNALPETTLFLYGLVLVFCVQLTLVSCRHPSTSRLQASVFGSFIAILSTVCGMGLVLRLGLDLNMFLMGMLPFFSIGVGFDDVFVIIFGVTEMDPEFFDANTARTISGELYSRVGRGVTLSTACTCIAFSLGTMVPIQIISQFCIGVVICSALNWFHMMTTFGVVMVCEVGRIQQKLPESICCPCQMGLCSCCCSIGREETTEDTRRDWACGLQNKILDFLYERWAPCLAKLPVALLVFMVGLVGFGAAMWPVVTMEAGSRQAISFKSSFGDAVEALFSHADALIWVAALYEIDVPAKQQDIMNTLLQAEKAGGGTTTGNFVAVFTQTVSQLQAAAFAEYQASNRTLIMNTGDMRINNNDLNDPAGMNDPVTMLDPSGNRIVMIPTKRDLWYQTWHGFVDFPPDATDAITKLFTGDIGFLIGDSIAANQFIYHNVPDPKTAPLRISSVSGEVKIGDFDGLVPTVNSVEEVFSKARAEKFDGGGFIVTTPYWLDTAAYPVLERTFYTLFAIDIAAILVVSALLLGSVLASIVTSVVCAMVVFETLAMALQMMRFNPFAVVVGLAALGIAVEDIAHNVCSFIVEPGSVAHRLGTAMRATFVPTFQGSFSTCVGLIPMAWSETPWAVDMSLFPFVCIIVFGFINGMIIAPSLCSVLSNVTDGIGKRRQAEVV